MDAIRVHVQSGIRRRESMSTTTTKEAGVEATLAQLSDNQQPGEPPKVAKRRKRGKAAKANE
jgi:hypothetical protein